MFSPKIELIDHFDNLINRVDIDIEECLEKYNDQVLGDFFQVKNRKNRKIVKNSKFILNYHDCIQSSQTNNKQTTEIWPESTKVVDYLSQIRMRTIEELRKEQKDSVENSSQFNYLRVSISDENKKEELKNQLFADRFYFQVKITGAEYKNHCFFNLFTFVTDFYMSQSDIDLLE